MAQAAIKLITTGGDVEPPSTLLPGAGPEGESRSLLPAVPYDDEGFARLVHMAEITADLVEKLFSVRPQNAGPDDYFIHDREREHAQFAVWHLAWMISEQKRVFDKATGAK